MLVLVVREVVWFPFLFWISRSSLEDKQALFSCCSLSHTLSHLLFLPSHLSSLFLSPEGIHFFLSPSFDWKREGCLNEISLLRSSRRFTSFSFLIFLFYLSFPSSFPLMFFFLLCLVVKETVILGYHIGTWNELNEVGKWMIDSWGFKWRTTPSHKQIDRWIRKEIKASFGDEMAQEKAAVWKSVNTYLCVGIYTHSDLRKTCTMRLCCPIYKTAIWTHLQTFPSFLFLLALRDRGHVSIRRRAGMWIYLRLSCPNSSFASRPTVWSLNYVGSRSLHAQFRCAPRLPVQYLLCTQGYASIRRSVP